MNGNFDYPMGRKRLRGTGITTGLAQVRPPTSEPVPTPTERKAVPSRSTDSTTRLLDFINQRDPLRTPPLHIGAGHPITFPKRTSGRNFVKSTMTMTMPHATAARKLAENG
jgi:hypothetical protein